MPPAIELSAWAPPETVALLSATGYRPDWFRSMFTLDLAARPQSNDAPNDVVIGVVDEETRDSWLDALAVGNGITESDRRAVSDEYAMAQASLDGTTDLVALLDGEVVGCASLQVIEGIAWLGGAATRPEARGRGVQAALLRHRLDLARASGCALAAATALPAGTSARNLGRVGFQHVQTQVVVTR